MKPLTMAEYRRLTPRIPGNSGKKEGGESFSEANNEIWTSREMLL